MQELPAGVQHFPMIRKDNLLYVDKTGQLLSLIRQGRRFFLSRPRRFGKSLTISTLAAMFSAQQELFRGLAAETWVKQESSHPVILLDLSALSSCSTPLELESALVIYLQKQARLHKISLHAAPKADLMLSDLLNAAFQKSGPLVLLIDEYDKPILDNIDNAERAQALRNVLRSFYSVLKSHDDQLRFLFITGISKFTKVGVFSALNNLVDISLMRKFSDIVGYTQTELESNFSEYINNSSKDLKLSQTNVLELLKKYYDGYSFDGETKLYNPFSILNFFISSELKNYWYDSGSPTFIVQWMKKHHIQSPDSYRDKTVPLDFTTCHEMEMSEPENFLFQSGYLTIKNKKNDQYILDYPNQEVLISLSRMFLLSLYRLDTYSTFGNDIWQALGKGDIQELAHILNRALASIPYEDFSGRNEFWYRSLFLMLLRGANILAQAEVHTSLGRSDVTIFFKHLIFVLEFKFAKCSTDVPKMRVKGMEQLQTKHYAKAYLDKKPHLVQAILIADDEKREVLAYPWEEAMDSSNTGNTKASYQ